jgi:thymidine phosphorylase
VAVTEELVAEMVHLAGIAPDRAAARTRVRAAWDDGSAWDRLLHWLAAQGGRIDPDRDDFGLDCSPLAAEVTAPVDGWLAGTACRQLGLALADMGGARRRVEDPLDLGCGIEFLPRIGDRLARGDVVARLFSHRPHTLAAAQCRIAAALNFAPEPVPARRPVLARLD